MSKWKIYTPEGVQDILFDDCLLKRNIENKIRNLFAGYGYIEIETPTIEFYDVFSSDTSPVPQEAMFKFFDQQGRILVLKPDNTIPVARITATKCREMAYPLRFSYIGNVFRYNDYGGGKQNEFTQAGLEVLGVSTPESDAEVIAIAINALLATGLESFQIDIGQIEFFKGIIEETKLCDEEIEELRKLIDHKDFVGVGELLDRFDIKVELKKLIFELPALFGSTDVLDKARALTDNKRSLEAIENIRKVLEILDDYGLSQYVSVDLGMLRGLDYDTGIIFRGFTHGVGFPILTGGRYDRLVGEFGRECPATGFSFGINMIMVALQRQKLVNDKVQIDSVIRYEVPGRKKAFELSNELRRQGLKIEIDISRKNIEEVKDYAANKGIGGIINVLGNNEIEVHNIESGEIKRTTIEELIRGEYN